MYIGERQVRDRWWFLKMKALIQRMDINVHRWETGERQVMIPQDCQRSSVTFWLKVLIQRMDINVGLHRWETGDVSSRLAEKFSEVLTESVDTAVGIHQYHGELVKPVSIVHTLIDIARKKINLRWRCANNESAAYHQWCDQCVPPGRVYHRTGNRILQETNYQTITTSRTKAYLTRQYREQTMQHVQEVFSKQDIIVSILTRPWCRSIFKKRHDDKIPTDLIRLGIQNRSELIIRQLGCYRASMHVCCRL